MAYQRGWKKCLLTLILLLGFCAGTSSYAAKEEYFSEDPHVVGELKAKLVLAFIELKEITLKAMDLKSDYLTEEEVFKAQEHLTRIKQYKFEFLARLLKDHAYSLRKYFPDIYQTKKTPARSRFFFRYTTLLTSYYSALAEIGVAQDVPFFEAEADEFVHLQKHFKMKHAFVHDDSKKAYDSLLNKLHYTIRIAENKTNKIRFVTEISDPDHPDFMPIQKAQFFVEAPEGTLVAQKNSLNPDQFSPQQIEIFRAAVQGNAIGQQDAEDAFARMETKRLLGATDGKPQKVWLMGPTATGKDTYTHAFASALSLGTNSDGADHVFELPVVHNEGDLSTITGSSTGYVGSNAQSRFVHFLVDHSGGKYHIDLDDTGKEIVLDGPHPEHEGATYSPSQAVVFINKIDQWSSEFIDKILIDLVSKGKMVIRAPGQDGLAEIQIPVNIVVASQHGSEIIFPDDREGKEVSIKQALSNYEAARKDKTKLRNAIERRGSLRLDRPDERPRSVPSDFTNLFSNEELVLFKPHDEEVLKEITRRKIQGKIKTYQGIQRYLGQANFEIPPETVAYLSKFKRKITDGAKGIDSLIDDFIEKPIINALQNGELKDEGQPGRSYVLGIIEDKEGHILLQIKTRDPQNASAFLEDKTQNIFVRTIETPPDLFGEVEKIKFANFEKNFSKHIFGFQELGKQFSKALYLSEALSRRSNIGKARRFMELGLSATGKTQTAKEVNRFYYGEDAQLEMIDFNNVNHKQDVQDLLYGRRGEGPSPFMKAYDKTNGKVLILLDEIANVKDINVLVPLYQLLDEAKVTGFNDNVPRLMENVTFILTGNATEEIYRVIMRSIPEEIQRQAQMDIYQRFNNDPQYKRAVLESHFRQAFLNRFPPENIVIFPPLSHEALRELVHSKIAILEKGINENLKSRKIELQFESPENFEKFAEAIEWAAFDVWVQGRSIESFINENLDADILVALKELHLKDGEPVVLKFLETKETDTHDSKRRDIIVALEHAGESHKIQVQGKKVLSRVSDTKVARLITGAHEAGHEIARRALSREFTKSKKVSIIPGVAEIAGEYIYYAGVASWEEIAKTCGTRNDMLAQMAELIAGGEAGRMVTVGNVSEHGQSNDLERTNAIAEIMILKWGLEGSWGFEGPGRGETVTQYLGRLSPEQRRKLELAKAKVIQEATDIAQEVLQKNRETLFAFGLEVTRLGEVDSVAIEKFFADHEVSDYWNKPKRGRISQAFKKVFDWTKKLNQAKAPSTRTPVLVKDYVSDLEKAEVAKIEDILADRKAAEIAHIKSPENLKYRSHQTAPASSMALVLVPSPHVSANCKDLLSFKK